MRKLSTHLEKYTLENKLWKETLWKIHFGKKKHFGNRSLQAVGHSFRKTFDDGDDGEDGGDDDNDDVNFMLT